MICKHCYRRRAVHEHHLFPNTKKNRELYPEYIDHPDNKIPTCEDCHLWKPIKKWSEKEFCDHFKISRRSKSGLL
jgi:epoxyqueuosine reductase QueG